MLVEKSWQTESMLRLGVYLFGCILLGSAATTWLVPSSEVAGGVSLGQVVIGTLSIHVAVFPLVHLFLREQGLTWREAFGFGGPGQVRALLLAAGVAAVVLPAAWMLTGWSGLVLQQLGEEPVAQPIVVAIQNSSTLASQLTRAVVAIALAPVAEEIMFRGILYPFLKQLGHPRLAGWVTALLFGAIHFNQLTFVALVVLGLVLAWLYERTGNLLAPILTHSLFNLANFLWLMLARA